MKIVLCECVRARMCVVERACSCTMDTYEICNMYYVPFSHFSTDYHQHNKLLVL